MRNKFTQTSLLAGICIALTLTGLGFIRTPLLNITFMHLPVIIGVLVVGKKEGIILGLIFGLCSLYQNIVAPGVTSFVFYNPMVSIFPRIMIPVSVISIGAIMKNTKNEIKVFICALVGSITNTALVLSMIYVFFAARYAQALNISQAAVKGVLLTTAFTNGLAEAIFISIISVLIVKALKKDLTV